MTLKEFKGSLGQFTKGYDDLEVVLREFGTNNEVPLELHTSISLKNRTFELVTKEEISCKSKKQ